MYQHLKLTITFGNFIPIILRGNVSEMFTWYLCHFLQSVIHPGSRRTCKFNIYAKERTMDSVKDSDQINTTKIETESVGPMTGRKEVLFDGYFYDVTDFVKRHPGGSIIEYYTKNGEDATHAIQQFHQRSTKRVTGIMNSLKKRPASDSESNYTADKLKRFECIINEIIFDFS